MGFIANCNTAVSVGVAYLPIVSPSNLIGARRVNSSNRLRPIHEFRCGGAVLSLIIINSIVRSAFPRPPSSYRYSPLPVHDLTPLPLSRSAICSVCTGKSSYIAAWPAAGVDAAGYRGCF